MINRVFGKMFKDNRGNEFGVIREAHSPFSDDLSGYDVLAEDDCGNYFVIVSNCIFFWDHETNKMTELSKTLDEFVSNCFDASDIELDPNEVISVWVDPEFAKEFGINPNPNKPFKQDF